jgi:phosphonate transport system ATP-binding protein
VSFQFINENLGYNETTVLRDISFTIANGERVALVGGSGAGKSTLLSALQSRFKDKAALIPQDVGLVHTLSVFHNVYIGRLNTHSTAYNLLNLLWPQKQEIAEISQLLERLGLADKLFKAAGELSGGQQQRTAVCRALYQGGGAVIGDEPVSAVDNHRANDVMKALCEQFDTIILAMHDIELALKYSNRIIGLKNGRITFDQPTEKLSREDLDFLFEN